MRRMKLARPSAMMTDSDRGARLAQIRRHIGRKEWEPATKQIQQLLAANPSERFAHSLLADIAYHTGDALLSEEQTQWLVINYPSELEYSANWVACAFRFGLTALAMERMKQFLARWPHSSNASVYQDKLAEIEQEIRNGFESIGIHSGDSMEMAVQNDRIELLILQKRFQEAIEVGRTALARDPGHFPIQNNIGNCLLFMGRIAEAAAEFTEVLAISKDNVHALGGLVRCELLCGCAKEANSCARRMLKSDTPSYRRTLKRAETMAMLADYPAVLRIFRAEKDDEELHDPDLMHFAAVALARTDKTKEAQDLWAAALKIDPTHSLARENLRDSVAVDCERNGAWAFDLRQVIPYKVFTDALSRLDDARASGIGEQVALELNEQYPVLTHMIGWSLSNGDPTGRLGMLIFAMLLPADDVKDELLHFAIGKLGTDDQRLEAYRRLWEAGLIDKQPHPIWWKGELRHTHLMGLRISFEPARNDHSRAVTRIIENTQPAFEAHDGKAAVTGMLKALALEPGSPTLINNLAAAYSILGDEDQYNRIIRDLHRDHPDYFFGRVNMAMLNIVAGELDSAQTLLEPLQSLDEFHIAEFRALCNASIKLASSRQDLAASLRWLELWEMVQPDDETCVRWREKLDMMSNLMKGFKRLTKPRSRKPRKPKQEPQQELEL